MITAESSPSWPTKTDNVNSSVFEDKDVMFAVVIKVLQIFPPFDLFSSIIETLSSLSITLTHGFYLLYPNYFQ